MSSVSVLERKIIRKTYGDVKEEEICRMRNNCEVDVVLEGGNIIRFVSS